MTYRTLLDEWQLTPDGEPRTGRSAQVWPVTTADGAHAVLKLVEPHEEAALEHLALQHWHGNGAVHLLRADPHRWALLLERLHDEDLSDHWDIEACETVADLYPRLHVPATPQYRTLSSYAAQWVDLLGALSRDAALPHRLVDQARSLCHDFATDESTDGTLIHTDLHYANVLAADREPWLAIDPKPLSGDPHYEPAPLLWNRWGELAGDLRGGVVRRFEAVVDAARLDEDRARDWVIVRAVVNAVEEPEDPEWVTRMVTLAKAIQR